MKLHLIEGEKGCQFAKEHGYVAVVVDALRASTTAAMLVHHGADSILAVQDVDEALRVKASRPEALLFGERDGVPPEGFDRGNSPLETEGVDGKQVVFTTTTGTLRLVEAFGVPALYMGANVNAMATMVKALSHDTDVVLIPAGLAGDPEFDALEDWVAATTMAMQTDCVIGEGAPYYRETRHMLDLDGLVKVMASAPHAEKLRALGFDDDLAFCSRLNVTDAVPVAVARDGLGVVLSS